MKIFKIKTGDYYKENSQNFFSELDCSVEEAIKKFAGKETLMLMWDNGDDTKSSFIIPSNKDNKISANLIADNIIQKVKEKL